MRLYLALAIFLLPGLARGADYLAYAAKLSVGMSEFSVGHKAGKTEKLFDFPPDGIQHTVARCALKPEAAKNAFSFGNQVEEARMNVHFQGDIINMSITYAASVDFAALLKAMNASLSSPTKTEYWTDGAHLYESSIWIDEKTEIEISRAIKGAVSDKRVTVFISSLSGNRPLSPEDRP